VQSTFVRFGVLLFVICITFLLVCGLNHKNVRRRLPTTTVTSPWSRNEGDGRRTPLVVTWPRCKSINIIIKTFFSRCSGAVSGNPSRAV